MASLNLLALCASPCSAACSPVLRSSFAQLSHARLGFTAVNLFPAFGFNGDNGPFQQLFEVFRNSAISSARSCRVTLELVFTQPNQFSVEGFLASPRAAWRPAPLRRRVRLPVASCSFSSSTVLTSTAIRARYVASAALTCGVQPQLGLFVKQFLDFARLLAEGGQLHFGGRKGAAKKLGLRHGFFHFAWELFVQSKHLFDLFLVGSRGRRLAFA